ncbi:MAG: protein adenylyltransferase SelO [Colwellia sp.]
MKFSNTYIKLGKAFYQSILPEPVYSPTVLLWNGPLAEHLGVPEQLINDSKQLAQYFSGNQMLEGAESIALAYSGHQFGHLNPQLGDGRAHLLGEVFDKDKHRHDIQLKGSGRTVWSRQGDGRCALGPALREYIMSEAMYALGVPTTRCLAVVVSGESVFRGTEKAGAIVTRVASSHIRVGTFQYFAIKSDMDSLLALTNYTITRHFAFIDEAENQQLETRVLSFLKAVMNKQQELIVNWLRIGFIHGVMNTDNTPICGETLDFGPCAMMNKYRGGTVFSSIDANGRYAFDQQGNITVWNMSRLAECLMMLLIHFTDKSQQEVIAVIEPLLHQFQKELQQATDLMYVNKLGFEAVCEQSLSASATLLALMDQHELDYTNTFAALTRVAASEHLTELTTDSEIGQQELTELFGQYLIPLVLKDWFVHWQQSLQKLSSDNGYNKQKTHKLMQKNNPVMIPRNHQVEQLLNLCEMGIEQGDITVGINTVNDYLKALKTPYSDNQYTQKYAYIPDGSDDYYQTFCGT